MSSSPTPACPTRSPPRAERWRRGAAALLLAALVGGAVAHGLEDHEADDTAPGVQLEGALALSAAHASQPWPAARLPGLFSNGDTPAGLLGNQRVQRLAASAAYLLRDDLRASVEAGVDRIGSERESFAALRLVWTPGALWRRDW